MGSSLPASPMAAPRLTQTKPRTKLALKRVAAGHTQIEMVRMTGLSEATYVRLEQGRHKNPPIRSLNNCAMVLRCSLMDLVEDEWLEWLSLDTTNAPTHEAQEKNAGAMDRVEARVRIELVPTSRGGRKTAITSGYRSLVRFANDDEDYGCEVSLDQESLAPGARASGRISLWAGQEAAVYDGLAFELREGGNIIGRGRTEQSA